MTSRGKIKYKGWNFEIIETLDVGCIILAGGKSLRLGHDKILETIGSKSLLEQVVSRVGPICRDIVIVTAGRRDISQFAGRRRVRMVTDIVPGKGPLGGIYTGLVTSDYSYNLVVAGDMPFLNEALPRHMIKLSDGFDIVVPRVGEMVEPLHAVYSKGCLVAIEGMIKLDNLSVNHLLRLVRARYVDAEEIDRFDRQHLSFFNINTKADMDAARKLAGGMVSDDKC